MRVGVLDTIRRFRVSKCHFMHLSVRYTKGHVSNRSICLCVGRPEGAVAQVGWERRVVGLLALVHQFVVVAAFGLGLGLVQHGQRLGRRPALVLGGLVQ